ncbi:glycosyltransferase family 4 protein [Lacihabitans sp. CS3-21]|uniref:MraY family glycosyltransferase n=1 Tax=Lacihabitans sp. CS3-21 TaxID=2487332 RepID=UPI0020CC716F|nr:glycosyltransferase family 4 protein [Lacihabitans sp. CS3-21]MCP9747552.1 glycosyltransferase family 4 protein [Lacihabitans sp. CS3-21]
MWYLLIFTLLFISMLLYFKIASFYGIVDNPNERSSHSVSTIRGGGIIFWISICIFFIVSKASFPYFFLGLTLISIISFIDDLKTLPNWIRLAVQVISVGLFFYEIQLFNQVSYWLIFPFFIFSVGIINAYNFMDGINGMTGSYSSILIFTFWIINTFHKEFIEGEILYYVFISLQVFNLFNFRTKAKCFAGDIGSISMAAIILFLLFKLIKVEGNYIYILFLSVYGIDTIQTIIFRLLKRENIFQAHKRHLFQILVNEKKLSHLYVSALYSFIQLGINLCVILSIVNGINSLFSTLVILVVLNLFYIYVRYRRAT